MNYEEITVKIEALEAFVATERDYTLAETQARELLSVVPETEHVFRVRVLLVLVISLGKRGMVRDALPYAEEALALATKEHNKELTAKALAITGVVYFDFSDYVKALEYYTRALALHEELGNKKGMASITGHIGNVYNSLAEYDKAFEYYTRALALHEELGNKREMGSNILNIGVMYKNRSENEMALEYYTRALALFEEFGSKSGMAATLGNIGIVYRSLSEYPKALEYFTRALALDEELGNKRGVASHTDNLGTVYQNLSEYAKALEYYTRALAIDEELGNKQGEARHYGNIGIVYWYLSEHTLAIEYHTRALAIVEELGTKREVAKWICNIGNVYYSLTEYSKALEYHARALAIDEELGNRSGWAYTIGNIGEVQYHLSEYSIALEHFTRALEVFEEIGDKAGLGYITCNIGNVYANVKFGDYNLEKAEAYLLKSLFIFEGIGAKSELFEVHKILAELYEQQERWKESQLHFKKFYVGEKEIKKEEALKQAIMMEQNKQAAEHEKHRAAERARSQERENILNNILPEEITTRLIKGENPIADHFDSVSILFMDIVDFTPLASRITAQQLVHLLNAIFSAADGVMREFGLEKIKTIGDAYMAVAGAPIVQEDHAQRAAQAALKLLDVMENLVVVFPDNYGDKSWIESIPEIQVRIGLHCGPVAAGVVGENKFLYDLWGDAVNTASRMESHGEPGKIHVSEEFKHAVETLHATSLQLHAPSLQLHATSLQFIRRGEMDIKGKGVMNTYFLQKANT